MDGFKYLMEQCLYFIRYKWTIWGFTFSFLDVWFYLAFFELAFAFIWQIFGQIPHSLNGSSEKNYNYSGINNGKGGTHKYGTGKRG